MPVVVLAHRLTVRHELLLGCGACLIATWSTLQLIQFIQDRTGVIPPAFPSPSLQQLANFCTDIIGPHAIGQHLAHFFTYRGHWRGFGCQLRVRYGLAVCVGMVVRALVAPVALLVVVPEVASCRRAVVGAVPARCRPTRARGVPALASIKKTTKAFDDPVDAKRTLRELKLLNHLSHENIVRLVDVLPGGATCAREQQDVYVAMESMDTDLHQIIRSKQALSDEHAQYFMYQLFCALQFMHSADVLHRDLKPGCAHIPASASSSARPVVTRGRAHVCMCANLDPRSNLLVNKNCDLKVCDFGLARIASGVGGELEKTDPMTEYVITRWYRPPELILVRRSRTHPRSHLHGYPRSHLARLLHFVQTCHCCTTDARVDKVLQPGD